MSGSLAGPGPGADRNALIEGTIRFVRETMRDIGASHGWGHVERVWRTARRLAVEEGADLLIAETAALLHDIGRAEEFAAGGKKCHAALGSAMARNYLTGLGLEHAWCERVARCVAEHRYRGGLVPSSLEAQVLFDADKLDSIGAIGVGRAFLFAGEVGAVLHNPSTDFTATPAYSAEDTAYREYCVKLMAIRDSLFTAAGRRIAGRRHDFMAGFFERLTAETAGLE